MPQSTGTPVQTGMGPLQDAYRDVLDHTQNCKGCTGDGYCEVGRPLWRAFRKLWNVRNR